MLHQRALDFEGKDVEAARDDQIALAISDVEVAVLIELADIAGVMPTELPDLGTRRLVIKIAGHDRRPAQHDLAGFIRTEQSPALVHDAHVLDDHGGPSA